jgi:hypothetical protein
VRSYSPSIEAIAQEAAVSPAQVQQVATAVLRALHRTAVTNQEGLTAAVMETRFCFGPEACYHFTGLLEHQRTESDPELPWSETIMRLDPRLRAYRAILDKWLNPEAET